MELATIEAQPTLGLDLPPTLPLDDWRDLGRKLCASGRALNWLIGDWLDFGLSHYPEAQAEALAIFRADERRLDPILQTCRKFPRERRRDNLTFGHHAALLKLPYDLAEALLVEAERHRVTVPMLRAQARAALAERQGSVELSDDDPEDTEYRRIVQAWNNASHAARRNFIEAVEEVNMGVIEL